MVTVDTLSVGKPAEGWSARLFAVELGITGFSTELSELAVGALCAADLLLKHGFSQADTAKIMRWLGPQLAEVPAEKFRLATLTILDYRYAIFVPVAKSVYDFREDASLPLVTLAQLMDPGVSLALCFKGLVQRVQPK